jgi:hypothetical protein
MWLFSALMHGIHGPSNARKTVKTVRVCKRIGGDSERTVLLQRRPMQR